jgi:hypothetical protein
VSPDLPVTEEEANAVWDVLVIHVGAYDSSNARADFILHQTTGFCPEYRFGGTLGFGGKIYRTDARGRWRVSCYREDETPERLHAMALANEALLRVPA